MWHCKCGQLNEITQIHCSKCKQRKNFNESKYFRPISSPPPPSSDRANYSAVDPVLSAAATPVWPTPPVFCPVCWQHGNGFPQPAHVAICPSWPVQQKINAAAAISKLVSGSRPSYTEGAVSGKPPLVFTHHARMLNPQPESARAAPQKQRYSLGMSAIVPHDQGKGGQDKYSGRCGCGWTAAYVPLQIILDHQKSCLTYQRHKQFFYII